MALGAVLAEAAAAAAWSAETVAARCRRSLPLSKTEVSAATTRGSNFVLASELMEHVVLHTLGAADVTKASVFDDQYVSTGGQFYELMIGHDRFNATQLRHS